MTINPGSGSSPCWADWLPPDTAPHDGTEVLIKTNSGIVSAWFDYRESTPGIDDDGHYDWVCFDGQFTIDGELPILGWLPLPPNATDHRAGEQAQGEQK